MRSLIALSLFVLMLSPLTGCKSVETDHLIGETLSEEKAESIEGIWEFEDNALHLKHIGGGRFVVAGLDWEEDGFEIQLMEAVITKHAGTRFLHVRETEADQLDLGEADSDADESSELEDRPWVIAGMLTRMEDDLIVMTMIHFKAFADAMEAGDLEAELSDSENTLHIRGTKEALDNLIQEDALHELFHYEKPGVLTRLIDK